MSDSKAATVSWILVDSGLDFLRRSVTEMTQDPVDGKFATVHLFSAIEVLIKARLIREHWTLACAKVDGATLAGLMNGDTPTVDPTAGITRLRATVGLDISKQQESKVDGLRKLRNRYVHFAVISSGEAKVAVRATLGRGLDFAIWFLENHTRPGAPDQETVLIDECLEELAKVVHEFDTYVAERLATLHPTLAKFKTLLGCPNCLQPTLTLEEGEPPKCLLCWWEGKGEDSANSYVYNILKESEYAIIKDGGTWPVHTCPNCEDLALVAGVDLINNRDDTDPTHVFALACFACSFEATGADLDQCSYCGEWMEASEMTICGDCARDFYDRS